MESNALVNFASEKGSVEIRKVKKPKIGKDEVLLEVAYVGVCGSDLHQWTSDHSWPVNYPVVLGHEFSGTIIEIESDTGDWKIGDRVVSETAAIIDQNNPLSRQGLYNLDPFRKGFGYGVNGAMTKYVKVPARCLHHLPDTISLKHGCLSEPCAVAYNAVVNNSKIKPGDRVVVLGPGTIGVLCAAMAKLCGAQVAVVGLESDKERLMVAEKYDCETVIGDAMAWALASDKLGADCVVDAAGVGKTLEIALGLIRPGGCITKVGWSPEPIPFSLDPLVQKNVRLQGSFSHNWPIWEKVLSLLATGSLNVEPIIGGVWGLEDWEEAFNAMKSGHVVKSIIQPA
ncbi:MAG: zinc-binding dehydrogenase [Bacteroidota bacterium]